MMKKREKKKKKRASESLTCYNISYFCYPACICSLSGPASTRIFPNFLGNSRLPRIVLHCKRSVFGSRRRYPHCRHVCMIHPKTSTGPERLNVACRLHFPAPVGPVLGLSERGSSVSEYLPGSLSTGFFELEKISYLCVRNAIQLCCSIGHREAYECLASLELGASTDEFQGDIRIDDMWYAVSEIHSAHYSAQSWLMFSVEGIIICETSRECPYYLGM